MAKHSLDFWLTSEDLPDPSNRVTIDRDGKIVLTYTPNNLEAHERLIGKLKQAMKQTNCTMHGHDCHEGLFGRNLYVGQRIPLAGVAHQNGTIRFGHDPRTSALDVHCKAHEVDNLYVVDGSFFPSSAAVNPALTIMANALRVGDHLIERMKKYATSRLSRKCCRSKKFPKRRTPAPSTSIWRESLDCAREPRGCSLVTSSSS